MAERQRMKSIMHEKDGTCYLCDKLQRAGQIHGYVEEHHVFGGTANRKLSEKYGLKVYLCIQHHREGPEAVHKNAVNATLLKKEGQKAFERIHGSRQEFFEIFGKDWLEIDPVEEVIQDYDLQVRRAQEKRNAAGFRMLPKEEALTGIDSKYLEIEKAAAAKLLNERQFGNLVEIVGVLAGKEEVC